MRIKVFVEVKRSIVESENIIEIQLIGPKGGYYGTHWLPITSAVKFEQQLKRAIAKFQPAEVQS